MTRSLSTQTLFADRRGRRYLFPAVLMAAAGAGLAGPAAATQSRVDGVLTTCKATASPTSDPAQGVPGNLKPDYVQLLTSAGSSQYPSTGSCNVCHGSGSAKGGDAATNRSEAAKSNYAFFCGAANAAPTLTLTPAGDQAITEGATGSVAAKATDPNNDPVTITVKPSPLPAGAAFDGTTLTYTPPAGTAAKTPAVAFTFQATDKPASGTALSSPAQTVTFNVSAPAQPTNHPPVVPASSWSVTVGDATTYAFDVTATDADGDPLTLTTGALPAGLTFTPDATDSAIGHFSWAPNGPAAPGTHIVTVTASDGVAQASGTVTINVGAAAPGPGTGYVKAVRITRAHWHKRTSTLTIAGKIVAPKGTVRKGLRVSVTDAVSGAVLGTAEANARGGWGLVLKQTALVPCVIAATVDGKTASRKVDRAPESCRLHDDEDDDAEDEDRDELRKQRDSVSRAATTSRRRT